jgi:hypothetical protein
MNIHTPIKSYLGEIAAAAIEHSQVFKQKNSISRNLPIIINVLYAHLMVRHRKHCDNTTEILVIELFAMGAPKKIACGSPTARHTTNTSGMKMCARHVNVILKLQVTLKV